MINDYIYNEKKKEESWNVIRCSFYQELPFPFDFH